MEPASISTGAAVSIMKFWSILSAVCGSVVPIIALSNDEKVGFKKALLMAFTGSSFAIFLAPWIARGIGISGAEGFAALCWIMGATGVFITKILYKWLDNRGDELVTSIFERVFGKSLKDKNKEVEDKNG